MTILVVPSLKCNVRCEYCFAEGYENLDLGPYNIDAILKAMEEEHKQNPGDGFCLHGGECTIMNRKDFETIIAKMYEYQKSSSLQTNCYKIDDDLIRIYKQYNTHVGVSIDGLGELNCLRGFPKDKQKNLEYTKQVFDNITRLRKEGVEVGVIIVLSKANADTDEKLDKLIEFMLMLRSREIRGGRLNLMWTNNASLKKYELSELEASHAWLYLYDKLKEHPIMDWQPFREYTDNLMGFGHSSCSMGKCDYFCTLTKVILADGSLGNCDRTHQEGSVYTRSTLSDVRYQALKATECKDCRFWNCCYGGCPGEGRDGDWRHKTRFCGAIKAVYSRLETEIKYIFPNMCLLTDYKEPEDYFDELRKNSKRWFACAKLAWATAQNPSVWHPVVLRQHDNKQQQQVQPDGHGNFTNHEDAREKKQ